jgi:mono/diheme cytochrome c family protein
MKWAILALAAIGSVLAILQGAGVFHQNRPETVRIPYDDHAVVAQGGIIYANACASCHGKNLEGQRNWRERKANGRLPAPPHNEEGHTWHHPDGELFEITKYGTAAFAPPGYQTDMLGYEELLSDREILSVLAFIKAQWPAHIRERHDILSRGKG